MIVSCKILQTSSPLGREPLMYTLKPDSADSKLKPYSIVPALTIRSTDEGYWCKQYSHRNKDHNDANHSKRAETRNTNPQALNRKPQLEHGPFLGATGCGHRHSAGVSTASTRQAGA